jgi:hypothetical protein
LLVVHPSVSPQLLLQPPAPAQLRAQLPVHALMLHVVAALLHVRPQPLPAHATCAELAAAAVTEHPPPAHPKVHDVLASHSVAQPPPSHAKLQVAPLLHLKLQLALLSPPHARSHRPLSHTQSLPATHPSSVAVFPQAASVDRTRGPSIIISFFDMSFSRGPAHFRRRKGGPVDVGRTKQGMRQGV